MIVLLGESLCSLKRGLPGYPQSHVIGAIYNNNCYQSKWLDGCVESLLVHDPMKESSSPNPWGFWNTGKVFSKIYNVFYCSKKAQQDTKEEDPVSQVTKDWFQAVKTEDVTKIHQMLGAGTDINLRDKDGWTALHACAWNGLTEITQTFVGVSNCDVNCQGPSGSTPIALASQRGHTDVVKLLIGAKSDVQIPAVLGDKMDVTPLHLAAQNGHTEIVNLLIKAGAVVNAGMVVRGVGGVTPLHLAVEGDHMDVMDVLISAGCDIQSSTQPSSETAC